VGRDSEAEVGLLSLAQVEREVGKANLPPYSHPRLWPPVQPAPAPGQPLPHGLRGLGLSGGGGAAGRA